MNYTSEYWIEKLKLIPHPEGGFFKETYRSEESINSEQLPERFGGQRHFSTAIFYLLEKNQHSKFHKIKSDEMWHFYYGSPLTIYSIDEKGNLSEKKLGLDPESGESPQVLIKSGNWFGAKLNRIDSFCLAGCTVSPGFHFDDFEFGERDKLIKLFPEHKAIIKELT